jgi:hypothetical protein
LPNDPRHGRHDGSVTTQASARRPSAISARAPIENASSSTTEVNSSVPRHRSRRRSSARVASIAAATPDFMSQAPNPYNRSPSRRAVHGSDDHPSTASTVSTCPFSSSVGPGPLSTRATTFGRPGATGRASAATPCSSSQATTSPWTAPSSPG